MADKNEKLILSIDQGTSSSRVLLFSPNDWSVKFVHQKEFASLYPNEGWSEQDPMLLLNTVKEVKVICIIDYSYYHLYLIKPQKFLNQYNNHITFSAVFKCSSKISGG